MTWPTVAVATTNLDAGTDSPASARADLLDAVTKENQMIAHVSTFMATVLDDTTAAAARTTLGVLPNNFFRAYLSGNQSITSASWTKVNLNAETTDPAGQFDSGNFKFQPTIAGYYQMSAQVGFSCTATAIATIAAYLYKNGAAFSPSSSFYSSSNSFNSGSSVVSDVVYMNGSTDYLELYANCVFGSGTSLIVGAGASAAFMAGTLIGQ